jgi:nitrite reductase/ring-hydroxylating ferredoxin subunit
VVASPLQKQHFALDSGVSVEDDSIVVATYDTRVQNGIVEVSRWN